jgi:hypothetical protein
MFAVCWQAMHKVTPAADPVKSVLPCRVNPLKLVCTCKGFRKTSICAHIVAVNHRCGALHLRDELTRMQKKRKAKSGRPRMATGRRHMQPESSSDEQSEIDSDIENYPTSDDGEFWQ